MQLLPEFPANAGRPADDGRGVTGSGCCTRCGCHRLDRHRGVVDTDIQFFMEGVVVLCEGCASEIGSLVGMISTTKAEKLEADIARLTAERDQLQAERDLAVETVESLKNFGRVFASGDE